MILHSPAAEAAPEAPLQNHVGNLEGDNLERHQPVEPQRYRFINPSNLNDIVYLIVDQGISISTQFQMLGA